MDRIKVSPETMKAAEPYFAEIKEAVEGVRSGFRPLADFLAEIREEIAKP